MVKVTLGVPQNAIPHESFDRIAAHMNNYIAAKLADPQLVLNDGGAEKPEFCIFLLFPKAIA